MNMGITDTTDLLIWPFVILEGAFNWGLAALIWQLQKPQGLGDQIKLIQMSESGKYLMYTPMADVPYAARRMICGRIKRLYLAVLVLVLGLKGLTLLAA